MAGGCCRLVPSSPERGRPSTELLSRRTDRVEQPLILLAAIISSRVAVTAATSVSQVGLYRLLNVCGFYNIAPYVKALDVFIVKTATS